MDTLLEFKLVISAPKILNLLFVDDILLFLKAHDTNLEVLQWILIGFEQLLEMKINFFKYELIPFNIFTE
jgi:hypothetical protein